MDTDTVYVARHRSTAPPSEEQVYLEALAAWLVDCGRRSAPTSGRHARGAVWPLTDPADRLPVDGAS